jgi:hypothetical protein
VKNPATRNPAQLTRPQKKAPEPLGDHVLEALHTLESAQVRRRALPGFGGPSREHIGIKGSAPHRLGELRKAFKALSPDKKKLITKQLGSIDDIIRRGLRSITDTGEAILMTYFPREGASPDSVILKYAMDGSRITEAVVSHAKERADSHARTDALPKRQASRVNKAQFNFWLDPEFKRSMLAVKIQDPARSLESIYAEAFNDLFRKYEVPTVPNTEGPAVGKPRGPNRSPGG